MPIFAQVLFKGVLPAACMVITGCVSDPEQKPLPAERVDMAPWMTRNPGEKKAVPTSGVTTDRRGSDASLEPWRADASAVLPSGRSATSGGWSIVLFTTTNADEARDALHIAKTHAGLGSAFAEVRGKAIVVAFGDYPSAMDARAREDVERIRAVKVGDGFPFQRASVAPPPLERLQGSAPEFNLANVKSTPGLGWALYTLQIGAYAHIDNRAPTPSELAAFRKAAEAAAIQLRREGEEAFYYHGPHRSSVTVGLFGEKDYDVRSPGVGDSPALRALRRKYPYNLVNGATYKVKLPGQTESREQPSRVVVVPD